MPHAAAMAQDGARYRVEVLVLTLLEPQGAPQATPELRAFDDAVDLVQIKRNRETRAQKRDFLFSIGNARLLPDPPYRRTAEPEGPWDEVVLVEQRSDRMAAVWRNLRLSGLYRPEALLAWEQPAEPPFPALRIHNEAVIRTEDPWAHARTPATAPEPGNEAQQPAHLDKAFQYRIEDGVFELAPLPEPVYQFAMEGTVRLRRSRFLHFDLDLENRQPAAGIRMGIPGPPLLNRQQGYLVHALAQSRQVRTDRMEYFDSPALGALVWITEIEPEEEDSAE